MMFLGGDSEGIGLSGLSMNQKYQQTPHCLRLGFKNIPVTSVFTAAILSGIPFMEVPGTLDQSVRPDWWDDVIDVRSGRSTPMKNFHVIGDKLINPIVGVYIPIIRIPY